MAASALYTFAEAERHPVICFAHITNQIGNVENDFEKGESQGSQGLVNRSGFEKQKNQVTFSVEGLTDKVMH